MQGVLARVKRRSVAARPAARQTTSQQATHKAAETMPASTTSLRTKRAAAEVSDTAPSAAALTPAERAELLKVGQWGARSSPAEWSSLVASIKHSRSGLYPSDWSDAVLRGDLYRSAGHGHVDGFSGVKVSEFEL
jgi:hypothetical protein